MAALTKHVRFSTDICLLPFNNPVRLAEDLAVLDNISNGRVEVGFGMGYVPDEFKGFGLPVSRRLSLMEEGLDVLKLCFSGERFDYHGKRYYFDGVRITPEYVQAGGPPIWLAATTHASAKPRGSLRNTSIAARRLRKNNRSVSPANARKRAGSTALSGRYYSRLFCDR